MKKRQYIRFMSSIVTSILVAVSILGMQIAAMKPLCTIVLIVSSVLLFAIILVFLLENKIYKGYKYAYLYWKTKNNLEKELIDSGFGKQKKHYIELPRIKINFYNNLETGIIRIRNSIKFNNRLDDIVLSAALYDFVVSKHYTTRDCNQFVYELRNINVSYKQEFTSIEDFLNYHKTEYSLFLDARSSVNLKSILLVGITGSGKTYALLSLILQLCSKRFKPVFYIADPKNSTLMILANKLSIEKRASKINDIIELIERFGEIITQRENELNEYLERRITADYSDCALTPNILVIDEFTALSAKLATIEKARRERVFSILHDAILKGRQLGCFVFIIMQKSDSNYIPTSLRENIPLKIVLGNSGEQTYITAFGSNTEIPNYKFEKGEGIFVDSEYSNDPEFVQFPALDFDIIEAIDYIKERYY